MAATKKTANSYLAAKVHLRASLLPSKPVSILDCFAGDGTVWAGVFRLTGRMDDKRLPIDIRDDIGFHLPGDNLGWLKSIDLSRFSVVDLDAYGVPVTQLDVIFERQFRGIVFVTFIQSLYGQIPHKMLLDIGFSGAQIEKSPTLFGRRGWEYFLQWLALRGVREVTHVSLRRKHYLAFTCAERSLAGSDSRGEETLASLS